MRRLLLGLVAGAAVFILLLAGAGVWLFGTSSGARGILALVSAVTPVEIEAGDVRGRLADDLHLRDLTVSWGGGIARVKEVRLLWQPERLLRRDLAVEELRIENPEIRLKETDEPETPPDLSFPEVPSFLLQGRGEVNNLLVRNLVLHPAEGEPTAVDRLQTRLLWREGVLKVVDFVVAAPEGKVEGDGTVDFVAPALELDLIAGLEEAVRDLDRFSLRLDLDPASGPRRMRGPLRVSAGEGKSDRLRLEAAVDWEKERLSLDSIRLHRPDVEGELTGRASVTAREGWPLDLAVRISRLDLSPEIGTPTVLTGEIAASGNLEKYGGRFVLANDVPGWQGGRIEADFAGDDAQIALTEISGEWLRGTVAGNLSAGWQDGWRLQGDLSGRGLNPAEAVPDWPGRINFTVKGAAEGGKDAPLMAQLQGKLLKSTLRGRPLRGEVDASMRGDDLRLARLLLQGEGFDLSAEGRLRERISFRADIPRLSGLVPGVRGNVAGKGWVRWRDDYLTGVLSARGRDVAAEGVRVFRFSMEASHREKGGPFLVSADLTTLSTGEIRIPSASVAARGTLGAHTLRATVTGSDVGVRFAARGGYADGLWSGTVSDLQTSGRVPGRWTLAAPAPLSLSRERLKVPSFRLNGPGNESLRAAADLAFSPRRGTVEAEWNAIDLARANPWVSGTVLQGRSTGAMRMRWLPEERLELSGRMQAVGSALKDGRWLTVESARAEISWGPSGLKGEWATDFGELGSARGTVGSPHPAGTGLPPAWDLWARWNLPDLARISPWIPETTLAGRSSGEIALGWTQEGPVRLEGRGEMTGRVAHESLDLQVRRAEADLAWDRTGLKATWTIDLGNAGRTSGTASSPVPPQRALPQRGEIAAQWSSVDLALFSPWIPAMNVSGVSSGEIQGEVAEGGRIDLDAHVDLKGRIVREDVTVEIAGAKADVRWNGSGLRGDWRVDFAPGGRLVGEVSSPAPARIQLPERGKVRAAWEGIDLVHLRPWLPPGLLLEGMLSGALDGELLPGERLRVAGNARVDGGELQWEGEEGILTAPLRQAEMTFDWRDQALRGGMNLLLEDFGRASADVSLPLPAIFPVAFQPDGPLRGRVSASLQEKGLLQAFFPGLVQESRGRIELDARVGGTWRRPGLGGEARLTNAGAYLPAAGIRLREVGVVARLRGEEIHFSELRARSGEGNLEGGGVLRLREWTPVDYQFQIRGKDFQAVDLPELHIAVSPDLTVRGDPEKIVVRGEVRLPDVLISGRETEPPIEPSPDVVIVDAPRAPDRQFPVALDVQVRIVLGQHVLVRAEGIDARLEGNVLLTMRGLDSEAITARGEIRVAQGRYSAYGVTLDITRGNILFAGGPVDRPTLDILALRKAGEVRAGVRITGTPRQPQAQLTSEPAMPDTDILSYIVLGRPLGAGGGGANAGLLMLAANQLLSRGESAVLQDRIKRTLGIDVLEVESGGGEEDGARITVGKYLRPDLYISFGRALFTETQEVRVRYDLSRRWQVESSVGRESAVDLFYQIEFK